VTGIVDAGPTTYQVFWSYVHADDQAEAGRISLLAKLVENQIKTLALGEHVRIFVDGDGIGWGRPWTKTVDDALHEAKCFVPIITPRYFKSAYCRDELSAFHTLVSLRSRRLILPIYFFVVPDLDHRVRSKDPLIELVKGLQHKNWREVGLKDPASDPHRTAVRRVADQLITHIGQAFGDTTSSPGSISQSPDGEPPTEVDDILGRSEAHVERLRSLVQDVDVALRSRVPSGEPGGGQAARFVDLIAETGRLAPILEGPAEALHEATGPLIERLRIADAVIATDNLARAVALDPTTGTATLAEAIDERARQLDDLVRILEPSRNQLVDGLAWCPELNDVRARLAIAFDRLVEARTILWRWEEIARDARDTPGDANST